MTHIIGIDPGASGGLAVIGKEGVITTYKFKDQTHADISDMFEFVSELEGEKFAYLEKVHAMPKQGVSSTFKFGQSYGFLEGMLTAHKIPFDYVTPNRWQKYLGCQTKGDKNVTKSMAQRTWPKLKITHAIADSLLIAYYGLNVRR